jgi:HSP20 family protein
MNAYTLMFNQVSAPRVDVAETKQEYQLTAELPGVPQDKVQIQVIDGVLELSVATEGSAPAAEARWLLRERGTSGYQRSFRLPRDVDQAGIAAKLDNGLLVVTLPKLPEAQPRKVVVETAA